MNKHLNNQEISRRLKELRKAKEMSQQVLATRLGTHRLAITQIESGQRNVSAQELLHLSQILEFSLDKFASKNFNPLEMPTNMIDHSKSLQQTERISVPRLNINKFKNVFLYILEHCAGKPNVGETLLYKLLYFSDFNHYELHETHLTGATYKKLPYGPVPQSLKGIIQQMIDDQQIQRIKTTYHGFTQTKYLPLIHADLRTIDGAEKLTIDTVINQFSNWSASAISDYSHKDMPWKASEDGEIIDYELAFYREQPFSVRNYDETEEV